MSLRGTGQGSVERDLVSLHASSIHTALHLASQAVGMVAAAALSLLLVQLLPACPAGLRTPDALLRGTPARIPAQSTHKMHLLLPSSNGLRRSDLTTSLQPTALHSS